MNKNKANMIVSISPNLVRAVVKTMIITEDLL